MRPSGFYSEICGSAFQPDPVNYPGELSVGFPAGEHHTYFISSSIVMDSPSRLSIPATSNTSNYWILDTDYDSFSVVYDCNNKGDDDKSEFGWILTREKNPPQELVSRTKKILALASANFSFFLLDRFLYRGFRFKWHLHGRI